MTRDDLTGMYITHINHTYDCDTFFSEIPERFKGKQFLGDGEEGGIEYEFFLYNK